MENHSNASQFGNESSNCSIDESLQKFASVSWEIAYYGITPLHFIFGLPAHIVVILAFNKQKKNDIGYALQFFVSISKLCLLIFYVLYVITFNFFSGVGSNGATWFMRSYVLMWYAAHLSIPISNVFFILSVFLSVTLAGDRLFSMAAPVAYNKPNHTKHQFIAVAICVVITLLISIGGCFAQSVGVSDNHYVIIFIVSALSNIMGQIRVLILILSAISLVVLNVLLIYFYHKQRKQISQMISNVENIARRKRERTLLILTFYESLMIFLMCTLQPFLASLIVLITGLRISDCSLSFGFVAFLPLQDIPVELADLLEIYIIFACSASFRAIVVEAVPFLGGKTKQNPIQPQVVTVSSGGPPVNDQAP